MSRHARIRVLVISAVAVMAAAVWVAGDRQRSAANHSIEDLNRAHAVRFAVNRQEAELYEYFQTGSEAFLHEHEEAREDTVAAFAAMEQEGDAEGLVRAQQDVVRRWQRRVDEHLGHLRTGEEREIPPDEAASLSRLTEHFLSLNARYERELQTERKELQERAVMVTVALIVLLSAIFGGAGFLLFDRPTRREGRRRERHSRFADVLQLARTEDEAYQLVKRYLESNVPGGRATVLNRNNSANRLEPSTPVAGTELEHTLEGAEPESCIAIRGGRPHERKEGEQQLLTCDVCGASGQNTVCFPSLVGGEVIGAVLIEHPEELGRGEAGYLSSSISEASPIIANLRNLAIAEHQAATDALTGLPNSRSVQENLRRMAAHAGRTLTPLAAVLFDLDHFKRVNDTLGHGKGDEVLAAVGAVVTDSVRASDFVGRYGGEEFLALLPDTDRDGAVEAAEKLRAVIADLTVPGTAVRATASFGVAVLPDDAGEPDELIRMADRALYLAKANGRNRVEALPRESAEPSAAEPI